MAQPDPLALPRRLPLVSQPDNRNENTLTDAKLVNGYVEKDEFTGDYHVYKRPGILQSGATKSGNGYGTYNWQSDQYTIFGSVIYKNGTSHGTGLNTAGGVYRWSPSLGTPKRLVFGNGKATYYTDGTTVTLINPLTTVTAGSFIVAVEYTILTVGTTDFTLIGAASNTIGVVFTATGVGVGTGTATYPNNFPAETVKGIVYLDGTTYVATADASIRGCKTINDVTDWTDLLNRLTAQVEPDGAVALTKQLVYVVLLKEWTTEFFYDAANTTASPLGPVQGAKLNFGCANADSLRELDGTLFWLSTNRASGLQVVMVEQLKPTVISTKPVERLLSEVDLENVLSFAFRYEGHKFYGLTIVASNLTLVYDAAEKLWAQWTDTNGNYFPIIDVTYSVDYGPLLQHATNGKIYTVDSAYTTDDGDLITWDLYTPNFDGGTNRRKHMKILELVGDRTPGSIIYIRTNDKDYTSTGWTNFRRIDMNTPKPILANCGTFVRRAHHFQHRANTRLRLQAVELQLDLGVL